MTNSLRGEFHAVLAGERHRFDTTLGTIARIEEVCGGRSIMAILSGVVTSRRAADQMPLLSAALQAMGRSASEAEALAARATLPEAEAFVLALMGALGFKLAHEDQDAGEAGGEHGPLPVAPAGGYGGNSPLAA